MDDHIHPLRIGNFRAYWLSQDIVIGWQVYGIARQTYDIKVSAFLLGMIGLVQFVPLFLLTPIVGLTADTFDRRWIIRGVCYPIASRRRTPLMGRILFAPRARCGANP